MSTKLIQVQGIQITVSSQDDEDYISLTDMLKAKEGEFFISDWLRNRNTIEFIGVWEEINNPNFNYGEFAIIKSQVGLNGYKVSVKDLIEKANIICLRAKAGRYGGTYAHKDIAFEFGMWVSPAFKLYLIKELQRLKEDEASRNSLEFQVNRELAKVNYRVHTDAIKTHITPHHPTSKHGYIYASEAEMLNAVVFGKKAKTWKLENPHTEGNQRDNGTALDNALMAHLESLNSLFINQEKPIEVRFSLLQGEAEKYRESASKSRAMQRLQSQSTPLLGGEKKK